MTPEEFKKRIESLAPGTHAEVVDLTGTQDHYQAVIVSPAFTGKRTIQQHRMVYDLFTAEMKTEEVHAFTMRTFTPEEYEKITGKKAGQE